MSSTRCRRALAAATALSLTGAGVVALSGTATAAVGGPLTYGLTTDNRLVQFRADAPGTAVGATAGVAITGLGAGVDLVGIDVRPATGQLYAVGSNSQLYVIDPGSGAATAVGTPFTPALVGGSFGVDFNPTVDRLRIVSDAEQNLRINPITGGPSATNTANTANNATTQGDDPLRYAVTDVRTGTDPAVRGAAYTNNYVQVGNIATGTVLIDYDTADGAGTSGSSGQSGDVLVRQDPANAGTLVTAATSTVNVPVTATPAASGTVGLDIEARTNVGYALLPDAVSPSPGTAAPGIYRFTPGTGTGGAAFGTKTGDVFDALVEDIAIASPRVRLTPTGSVSVNEGSAQVFSVERVGDEADAVTVPVTVASASATVGVDVTAPGSVTIPAGARSATFTVSAAADNRTEGPEDVTVTLEQPTAPSNATLLTDRSATVRINDTSLTAQTPTPTPTAQRLGISVNPRVILPTVASVVTVTGTPGTEVELLAYSRPATTFRVVRRGVIAANGRIDFRVVPGTNTRLFARVVGQTTPGSPSVVINVRTALSLSVVRNGSRDYTFQGRVLPRRAGQLVTLYRVAGGREIIAAQARTDATGTYRIRRVFTGSGTFGFLARTGQNLTNAAGVSNGGRARPTAIYAGPQR